MPRINHKWECEFKGGKPVIIDEVAFKKDCLQLEGKKGYVALIPFRKVKTGEQNKYYRGVVVKRFADEWGCTNQEAHEAISWEHLRYHPKPGMPPITKSTRLEEWGTAEWEEYMEHLRRWGAQTFGLYIELPNEVDMDSLGDIYY
jgi:hypothetical protein